MNKMIMKVLGLAFAASLFSEGAAEYFGLGEVPPFGRMIIAVVVAIIVIKL